MNRGMWLLVALTVAASACQCGPTGTGTGGGTGGSAGGGTGGGSGGGSAQADAGCPPYTTKCGAQCLSTSSDPTHCGGCGTVCAVDAGQVCSAGQCTAPTGCRAGLTACAGACRDLQSDNAHCGTCPTACPAGQGCAAGTCVQSSTMGPGPATCPAAGAPFGITTGSQLLCAGSLAQVTFRWAICACDSIASSAPLTTRGIGGPLDGGGGAALGVNASFNSSGAVNVDGAFWCAGNNVIANNQLNVAQFLKSGGGLTVTPSGHVLTSAEVNGDINATNFTVGGTLTYPQSRTLTGTVTAGSTVRANVTVPPACDCSAAQKVPVAAIVNARVTANDNATVALDKDVLANPAGPVRLDLPCGHYFLSRIGSSHPAFIGVHGHVALYVDGDINASAPLSIVPDPGVELDIFMKGALTASNTLRLGNPNEAANTRVYTAGNGNINFSSSLVLGGFVYGPDSALVSSGPIEMYGGLFVRTMNPSAAVTVNFDRAISGAGSSCPTPVLDAGTTGCTTCRDCNNQACKGGTCGACTRDSDCCAPLQCSNGVCIGVIN